MRPIRPAAVLLSVLLVACGKDSVDTLPPRPVLVQQPQPAGDAVQAFAGEVRARHEATLAFRVSGKITARRVDVGDRVTAGQVLAALDPNDLRLQREAARAQVQAAESDLALAEAEMARARTLLERQLISRSLFDARQTALTAAQSRAEQARAQARVAGNQTDYSVLRAPAAGVITQRMAEAGQVIAAGQPIFGIAHEGEREIAIALPESDVSRFRPGHPVLIELWAGGGERLPGVVREIAPAADPAGRTYAARVSFAGGQGPAELGQSARVYAGNPAAGGLSVPLSALTEKGGQRIVWVVQPDGTVKPAPVATGPFNERDVPIASGVVAADWVVISGAHLLRAGERVLPVDRNNRPVALLPPGSAG